MVPDDQDRYGAAAALIAMGLVFWGAVPYLNATGGLRAVLIGLGISSAVIGLAGFLAEASKDFNFSRGLDDLGATLFLVALATGLHFVGVALSGAWERAARWLVFLLSIGVALGIGMTAERLVTGMPQDLQADLSWRDLVRWLTAVLGLAAAILNILRAVS